MWPEDGGGRTHGVLTCWGFQDWAAGSEGGRSAELDDAMKGTRKERVRHTRQGSSTDPVLMTRRPNLWEAFFYIASFGIILVFQDSLTCSLEARMVNADPHQLMSNRWPYRSAGGGGLGRPVARWRSEAA